MLVLLVTFLRTAVRTMKIIRAEKNQKAAAAAIWPAAKKRQPPIRVDKERRSSTNTPLLNKGSEEIQYYGGPDNAILNKRKFRWLPVIFQKKMKCRLLYKI
jgi:hypothetical protein